jgi:hypothetical protein
MEKKKLPVPVWIALIDGVVRIVQAIFGKRKNKQNEKNT